MIDLAEHISPGDGVWWSQTGSEPTPLVDALLDQVDTIGPVRAFVGMTYHRRLTHEPPAALTVESYGALGDLRALSKTGRLEVVRSDYSALPGLFASGRLPHDIALVQVSPADSEGLHSLGIGADYAADALANARTVIAEINHRMPATTGSARIARSRFAAVVETDRPLIAASPASPSEVDRAVAEHVAGLIRDGDTIQIGVGALPDAVLARLDDRRALGVHSGLISDGILRLVETGVITGERKELGRGRVVTGSSFGSELLSARIAELPIEFRATSFTHDPHVLARLASLVSINSAIEVDLAGNVNAETRRGHYVGARGGHRDFSRAASATGRLSIIALRSRSGTHSAIVPKVETLTTAGSAVDVVVTEHGIADIRSCSPAERAARLIAIAAPDAREGLDRAARSAEAAA